MIEGPYDMERFVRDVALSDELRCSICYRIRLSAAADYAKSEGYDAFTTTLLVSPYQKHEILREIGEAVASECGIPFVYKDFRSGWKESVEISRKLGLYRQKYCGCIYSERERFDRDNRRQESGPYDKESSKPEQDEAT
jgi:predicted adenine nucleotide alpha hydrolase (AANH) superfamily ATPase